MDTAAFNYLPESQVEVTLVDSNHLHVLVKDTTLNGRNITIEISPKKGTKIVKPIQEDTNTKDVNKFWIEYHNKATGPRPQVGDKVKVNYIGTYLDYKQVHKYNHWEPVPQKKFDSSYDRGQPIEFTLG